MSLMYLEDYLELVSFLPQEFCDRLTKVRELDLEASNRRDSIEKMKEKLCPDLAVKGRSGPSDVVPAKDPLSAAEKTALIAEITAEYDKIVDLGVEKVKIVSALEELMLRYNRRLMADTEKFKMELEADNPGITESLESRAEQDMHNLRDNIPAKLTPPEVRVPSSRRIADMGLMMALQRQQQKPQQPVASKNAFHTPLNEHAAQRRPNMLHGQGTNMLARAASQAIAATQNLATGRRTASLKASYEASVRDTPSVLSSRDHSIDRNDAAPAGVSSVFGQSERRKRQPQRKVERFADDDESEDPGVEAADEDNKLYCFCRQPSAGFMIACDNSSCAIEWFHGTCVGVKDSSGEVSAKWYCPDCRGQMERDRRQKAAGGGSGPYARDRLMGQHGGLKHEPVTLKVPGKKFRRPQ